MSDDFKERLRNTDHNWHEAACAEAEHRIEAQAAEIERLRDLLGRADAALRGANMNMNVVERKIRAALAGKAEQ